MFDLTVKEFRERLITETNASGLPATMLVYIMQDMLTMAQRAQSEQLQLQLQQRAAEQQTQQVITPVTQDPVEVPSTPVQSDPA
jgi:hypothetical protein